MAGATRTSLTKAYRLGAAAILLFGLAASAYVFRDLRLSEDRQSENEFVRRATLRHALSQEVLSRYAESLFALSAVFSSNANLPHVEFTRATARLEQRLPGVKAFEWVPYVPGERRAEVEAEMLQQYRRRGFQFIDFDAQGRATRSPDRPFHYPICFIEPLRGNEIAVGYDLTSGPTMAFLERARLTRQMVVTRPLKLIQETTSQLGIVMIWPIYTAEPGTRPATHATGTGESFAGFLQCVFRVHDLLETVCQNGPETFFDTMFVDVSENDPSRRVLYFHPTTGRSTGAISESEFKQHAPMICELDLPLGGRHWRVLYRPDPEWLVARRTLEPQIRAAAVLLLSALLAGLVIVIGRQTHTIQRQVDERTLELAESRRQFANLVHALPGLAYRALLAQQGRLQFASEGALALTGWTAEELVNGGIDTRALIHPDDADRTQAETVAALRAHKDIEMEFRIRTRDGTDKSVLSRGRGVYDADGAPVAIEGILIDITQAKRAESERLALERKLLETQKLESLGLLAGGIAHDFNNLLSAILGNASLARMTLEGNTAVDPQLRAIETASLRAAELCRQMLAYAGKGRFIVERVNLSAIVDDLLPLLRVSIARSATLRLELSPELPSVKADATQVRQIVMNLVLNAVDALAGREGMIRIRTGAETVDRTLLSQCVTGQALPVGDYVFLEVKDTGCGMPSEIRAKIFDPFFTTKFAGRGLGLAAVLGIVRSHNGALYVESEVGRGSTFRLYLPAVAGEAAPVRTPAALQPPAWRHTGDVLVVEDEEPVRDVMVDLLKTFGLQPRAAADGRAGVAAFREDPGRWAVVVLDLLMPGMSGEQALAEIRASRPETPVLLVSGYAEPEIVHRLSNGGRLEFLAKPFRSEAFAAKLRDLLA